MKIIINKASQKKQELSSYCCEHPVLAPAIATGIIGIATAIFYTIGTYDGSFMDKIHFSPLY